jgi:hypothetical protein
MHFISTDGTTVPKNDSDLGHPLFHDLLGSEDDKTAFAGRQDFVDLSVMKIFVHNAM